MQNGIFDLVKVQVEGENTSLCMKTASYNTDKI